MGLLRREQVESICCRVVSDIVFRGTSEEEAEVASKKLFRGELAEAQELRSVSELCRKRQLDCLEPSAIAYDPV
jgi:hypothetical protein